MASFFTEASIENLKNQLDIVSVIGSAIELKRAGTNYKGRCPFHNEKTPSFIVSEKKQIFKCFGCGESGNAINFVMKYYNLTFPEAVEKLATEYGITLERKEGGEDLSQYYEANKQAARFFYNQLTSGKNPGYEYLAKRGIAPNIMKRFGLGYAPDSWDSLYKYLAEKGFSEEVLIDLGLCSKSSKGNVIDKFRNRVIFPIINTSGKVIGFGGRALSNEDNPKYLNSPESKIFKKKNNLYGLNISRESISKKDQVIVVEGYMDTISLSQYGVDNVVATLGTALTENQVKLLKRYTKNIVLSYDSDSAGRNAALRGIEIINDQQCKVKVLHVSEGKDPDEFIKANGAKAFENLVENSLGYGKYKLESAKTGYDLNREDQVIEYLKKAAHIIKGLSPLEQDKYIREVAGELQVSEGALRAQVSQDKLTPVSDYKQLPRGKELKKANSLSNLEKDFIKLVILKDSYIIDIAQLDNAFQSEVGITIFKKMCDEYFESGEIDINKVADSLEEEARDAISDIMENVVMGADLEKLLQESIVRHRLGILESKQNSLIEVLGIDNEEEHATQIMVQLQDIAMEIARLKESL